MRTMRNLLNPRVWAFFLLAALLSPVAQAACTYTLSPSGRNHGYGATSNTIQVLAGTGCVWSVSNPTAWITIQSGSNGTSTGTVAYAVAANTTINGRTGLVTIAGQTFPVSQDGLPCNYSVSPATRNHGSAGISNNPSFTVSSLTGCAWSVTTTSSWIFFTGITNSSGTSAVTYAVAASRIPVSRTGTVAVADQLFTLTQSAASCIYDVHIPNSALTNRLHGYGGSTGLVSVEVTSGQQNCDWFVVNSNTWISIIANPSGNGTGTFTYDVDPNPDAISRSGYMTVWNKAFYVLQNPAPCSVSFTPTSATTGADPETNTVLVTLAGGCSWGVTNTNSWITIMPLTNNSGSGSFTYVTAGNAVSLGRTGTVSVFDTNFFTIRQAGANCTYRLSPTNRVHGYGAATNTVNLSTLSVCPWTVIKTSSWVTVLSPTNGQGDSTITYALSQNGGAGDRSTVVLIGGQPFNLTQHALGCAINLSPSTRNHGYSAATNTVSVNTGAGCAWDVAVTNSWITILSSTNGVGSNIFTYAVQANSNGVARTGYLLIEDQAVTLIQAAAPCTYQLTPASFLHSALQETGTVSVSSLNGCNWTVVNTNPWVSLLSSTNGTGSTNVSYFVTTNLSPSARSGVLTIAGLNYSVVQDGVTCSYKISPTNRVHGYAATTNIWSVTVSNPCPWSVVNTNSWITILSGASGVGTGTVSYALSVNNVSANDRVGTVVIGGQLSQITQHGIGCGYKLSPTNRSHGFGSATGMVSITAAPTCSWALVNTNGWITITTPTTGTGNSNFTYTVQPNFGSTTRTGFITMEDEALTLSQSPSTGGFIFESIIYGLAGDVTLRLAGGPAGIWEIQRSGDLTNWVRVADITNTTGRVEKNIPGPASTNRFFRARLP